MNILSFLPSFPLGPSPYTIYLLKDTHTRTSYLNKYTLTGPDVGESFSVAQGKYCCFSLSGALPVQLNKLVSYVDVLKFIIIKVPIFVQNGPVHKCIKRQPSIIQILMDILFQIFVVKDPKI